MTRRPKHGRRSSITSPPRGLAEHTDLGRSTPSSLSPQDRRGEPRDKAAARLRRRHEAAKQALEEAQAKVLGSNADLSSQLDLILDMVSATASYTRTPAGRCTRLIAVCDLRLSTGWRRTLRYAFNCSTDFAQPAAPFLYADVTCNSTLNPNSRRRRAILRRRRWHQSGLTRPCSCQETDISQAPDSRVTGPSPGSIRRHRYS